MTEALVLFERLGAYALTWSWQVSVLILFAWIAVKLDRRHRPTLRHSLWVLTLLFSLLLPWIPARIAALPWTQDVRQVLATPVATSAKPAAQVAERALDSSPSVASEVQATGVPYAGSTGAARWNFLQVTGLLWAVGVGFAAFRRAREHWRLHRIASNAALAPDADASTPPILLSRDVLSPMLYGWFHPVVLLPEDVSNWSTPDQHATMIRHELVHYVRKDHWLAALAGLIRTVFFFHPLVRWTCRQVDIERELACDEEVLRQGAEPATYAEAILKVAEHALDSKAACGVHFAATARLDRRIDMLFRTPPRVVRSTVLVLPASFLLVPIAALGFWQSRVEASPPIEFSIQVNPVGLIPEEILAPAPRAIPVAAVTPPAIRFQDPPVNPVAPARPLASRLRVAVLKITEDQAMANITLALPYSQFSFKEVTAADQTRIRRATARIEGQITILTGKVIQTIEDTLDVDFPAAGFNPAGVAVYQKTLYLEPGLYRMFILVSDPNGGTLGTIDTRLEVPRFSPDRLSTSSLILADLVEPVPLGSVSPSFRIGSLRVRPNMSELGRDQNLNIFQQVYVSAKETGSILPVYMETLITLDGREVRRVSEQLQRSADRWGMTITKKISLAEFTPGVYSIQTAYTDAATGERVVSKGEFSVR